MDSEKKKKSGSTIKRNLVNSSLDAQTKRDGSSMPWLSTSTYRLISTDPYRFGDVLGKNHVKTQFFCYCFA